MFFYSVFYSNGQILNILCTSVKIFKYQKIKTNFSSVTSTAYPHL